MKNFKKIIFGLFLTIVAFQPQTFGAALARVADEIDDEVDAGVDAALGKISGEGRALSESQITVLKSEINSVFKEMKIAMPEEVARGTAKAITEKIVSRLRTSQDASFAEVTAEETDITAVSDQALATAKEVFTGDPDRLNSFVSDMKAAKLGSENAFNEVSVTSKSTEGSNGETESDMARTGDAVGSLQGDGDAVEGGLAKNSDGAGLQNSVRAATEKQFESWHSPITNKIIAAKNFVTGNFEGPLDKLQVKLDSALNTLDSQLSKRSTFIDSTKEGGSVTSGTDGMKIYKPTVNGKPITVSGKGSTTFDSVNSEFTFTDRAGNTIIIKPDGILKDVRDPASVKFKPNEKNELEWSFNGDDAEVFTPVKSVDKYGDVTEESKSFNQLANEEDRAVVESQQTFIRQDRESLNSAVGRAKMAAEVSLRFVWKFIKYLAKKVFGALKSAGHTILQALLFTLPNMLEAAKTQAAQLEEQYKMLTSAQKFGNLTVQIPAFLIPKGSPMSGLFVYIGVPQNTPEDEPNNFDDGTLLNAMYYVSMSDAYTPWGSAYIPQVGQLVNLNTGFDFGAAGSPSGVTEFIPLMSDKNATSTGNVGSGPVINYLQTLLGKGVGGQTSGTTHVTGWRDWIPVGGVSTTSSTITSNPVLSFLLADIKESEDTLPPAMFNTALTQFLKPMTVGLGPCADTISGFDKKVQKRAFEMCMSQGLNGIKVRQAMGIGFAAGVLTSVAQNQSLTQDVINQVQTMLTAQQALVNAITSTDTVSQSKTRVETMADANARAKMLTTKLDALMAANAAMSSYVTLGISPEVFINAMGIYVYETIDTPVAQFMLKHSPLAAVSVSIGKTLDVSASLLKDYVVFLDENYSIVPAYNARISYDGSFEYTQNDSVLYCCSLVSGRTYKLGYDTILAPIIPAGGQVTDIANQVWDALSTQLTNLDTTSGSGAGGTGKAVMNQISSMAAYATTLIVHGPYKKNGFKFSQVNMVLEQENEQESITLTFDQLASGATNKQITTVPSVPYTVKKQFLGQDGRDIVIYKGEGALGVDENGNLIDDYVIALGETTVTQTSSSGAISTRPAFIILPLSGDAFPNESPSKKGSNNGSASGITALVSLITGKVYTSDYIPQPPSRRMNVLMRNNNMSLINDQNSNVSVNGVSVGSVNLPMATAYMPTDCNPYNWVPVNNSDFNEQRTLQDTLGNAVSAYVSEKNEQNAQALQSAVLAINAFNQKIAAGKIPLEPRTIGSNLGDMLYVQNMYWAMYAGYNVCASVISAVPSISTTISASKFWLTGTVCSSQSELANNNSTLSLLSVLPSPNQNASNFSYKTLNDTFNAWYRQQVTSGAGLMFEEGPFNVVNGMYLTLSATNAKNGNYFYQALPSFDSSDLLLVAELVNSSAAPQVEYKLSDFKNVGTSFTQVSNPVLIDIKNGYVFIPTTPPSGCSSVLCNFTMVNGTLPRVFDVTGIIEQALETQNSTIDDLQTSNPLLASRLSYAMYQFEVAFQQLLTENFFAGKQLLLNPSAIDSYIYAVATAPATTDATTNAESYKDQVTAAWNTASDYWICGTIDATGQPALASNQMPLSSSTQCMISLVNGNIYFQSSTTSISNIYSGNNATNVSTYLLSQLTNVPASLTGGYLQLLASRYQISQIPPVPPVNLSVPVAFFSGLTQVKSPQFSNLYTDGKQYFIKASVPTITVDANSTINVSSEETVSFFAFNQMTPTGAPFGSDAGIGYYYELPPVTSQSSSQSVAPATSPVTSIQPSAGMREFNLQAMRAHYGVSVGVDGTQSLVLPMSSLPLPMNVSDKQLTPGESGTYMKYLGSLPSVNNSGEVDYYYQNTLAQNFLMRRVSTSTLSSFAQQATNANTTSITTDYYLDLVSGEAFNTDGSPRLHNVAVSYTSTGSGSETILNLTNPLFTWSQTDPTTELSTYYALFQQFDSNGYQLLSPQAYGVTYDVESNNAITRYGYQPSADGSSIVVTSAPVTNGQSGTPTVLVPLLDANQALTGMKTTLAKALQSGVLVAINTTCIDGTIVSQIPSVPSVYTVVPASGNSTLVFTQVLPGVTKITSATKSVTNNFAYETAAQIEAFLEGIPFVATITGNVAAGSTGATTSVTFTSTLDSQDYYVCGLMSSAKGLLSIVASYPNTTKLPAGRYYFIANQTDSNANNTVWSVPQLGQSYTNTLVSPQVDPSSSSYMMGLPSIQGGVFNYATVVAQTTPPASAYNALAPAGWGTASLYLVLSSQQAGSDGVSNVSIAGSSQKVFNFMYDSIERADLSSVNNNVQVVTSLQGNSQLAAPIPVGQLQGAALAQSQITTAPVENNQNVSFYPGNGLVKPCSLYQVQGTESITAQKLNTTTTPPQVESAIIEAPFNEPAPTYAGSNASIEPMVSVGTYIDIATGAMYTLQAGVLYPLPYGAPMGTTAFLHTFLSISGVDSATGKLVIAAPTVSSATNSSM